jgi:hypothetical protein
MCGVVAAARACLVPETAGPAPRRFMSRAGASRRVVLKAFIRNDFQLLLGTAEDAAPSFCFSPDVSVGASAPAQRAVLSWANDGKRGYL